MFDKYVLFREVLEHWRVVRILFESEARLITRQLFEVAFYSEYFALYHISDDGTDFLPSRLMRLNFADVLLRSNSFHIKFTRTFRRCARTEIRIISFGPNRWRIRVPLRDLYVECR